MSSLLDRFSLKPKRAFHAPFYSALSIVILMFGAGAALAEGGGWSGVTSVTGDSASSTNKTPQPATNKTSPSDATKTSTPAATSNSSGPASETPTPGSGSSDGWTSVGSAGTGTVGGSGDTPSNSSTAAPFGSNAVPIWDGSGASPTTPVVKPNVPAKAPKGDGRPQIAIQMPPPKQLAYMLRMNEPAARSRIAIATERCRQHLSKAGMDPNLDIDDAMELSKPVINIYLKKSVGDNILAHGFCMQAFLMQYQRRPSGKVDTVRCARIGESPEIYSGADWEDKVVTLVDAYLSARHHQLKEAAKAKPGAVKGKKK